MSVLSMVCAANTARAVDGPAVTTDYLTAQLVADADSSGCTVETCAGLDLQLKPGWHSYWRMPGEGGLAPKFDWSKSTNVKTARVLWPLPRRFEQQGLFSFGYEGHVVLPVEVRSATPGDAATLRLKAELMVCKDICIPQPLALALDIPGAGGSKIETDPRIEAALKTVPHDGDLPALKIDGAVIGPKALVVRAYSASGFKDADLFAEVKDGAFYFTAPPVVTSDAKDPRHATLAMSPPEGTGKLAEGLMRHKVTLTLSVKDGPAIEKAIDF